MGPGVVKGGGWALGVLFCLTVKRVSTNERPFSRPKTRLKWDCDGGPQIELLILVLVWEIGSGGVRTGVREWPW